MKRKAFTLIELIITITISAILAIGTFKAVEAIYIRGQKVKNITQLSLDTQSVADQLSLLLYDRIPASVIGYNPDNDVIDFRPLSDISGNENYTVLEWLGIAREALNHRSYSCFIDLSKSDKENNKIFSPDTNGTKISKIVRKKLNISEDIYSQGIVNLVFAGSFDESTLEQDFNDSFGWHGNDSYASLDINISDEGNITIVDSHQPNYIYEKYYLVDTAYAVARGIDVNISLCSDLNNTNVKKDNNTLYLFFNYRPWKGETFCGDKRSDANRSGNVTILMQDVTAFEAFTVDRTIRFKIDSYRNIRGTTSRVHISKQKVVF